MLGFAAPGGCAAITWYISTGTLMLDVAGVVLVCRAVVVVVRDPCPVELRARELPLGGPTVIKRPATRTAAKAAPAPARSSHTFGR